MDFTTEEGAVGSDGHVFIYHKQTKEVMAFAAEWQAAAFMALSTLPIKP